MTKTPLLLACLLPVVLTLGPASAQAQVSDTTPPDVTAVSLTPASVDVTASPATVSLSVVAVDDLSGVAKVKAVLTAPTGARVEMTLQPSMGAHLGDFTVPRAAAPGEWKLSLEVQDEATNTAVFSDALLAQRGFPSSVAVDSTDGDLTPPAIVGAWFDPPAVDVSSGPATVQLSLHLQDDRAGVAFDPAYVVSYASYLAGPANQLIRLFNADFSLVSGTPMDGVWRATFVMPRYADQADWGISTVPDGAPDHEPHSHPLARQHRGGAADGADPHRPVRRPRRCQLRGSDLLQPLLLQECFGAAVRHRRPPGLLAGLGHPVQRDLEGRHRPSPVRRGRNLADVLLPPGGRHLQHRGRYRRPAGRGRVPLDDRRDPTVARHRRTIPAGGGTVEDETFGPRASISDPAGVLGGSTDVAIDVLSTPLDLPNPSGFEGEATLYVNVELTPTPSYPLPAPGLTVVLPLDDPQPAGLQLNLYKIDPATGTLVPAIGVSGLPVVGFVGADGLSATFTGVVSFSTLVGLLPDALPVTIDVKPGDSMNRVNPRARGVLPVAVLGKPGFDPATIDRSTITLSGVSPRDGGCLQDVNRDRRRDLVLKFAIPALPIDRTGPTVLLFEARTRSGRRIKGSDTVRPTP
jgi:hypothetical protein